MNEVLDSVRKFFDIDFSSVKSYFLSLTLTIIFTYLLLFVSRVILRQLFKHTSLVEEKRKKRLRVSPKIHQGIFLRLLS